MSRIIDCISILWQKLYFLNTSLDYKSEEKKMQIPKSHPYVLKQLFLYSKKGNKDLLPFSSNKRFQYCVGEKEMGRVVMVCKIGDDWLS